jgi:hypothetical protein
MKKMHQLQFNNLHKYLFKYINQNYSDLLTTKNDVGPLRSTLLYENNYGSYKIQ